MALFRRRIEVIIEDINRLYTYPELEIKFEGEFNEDPEPNIFEVSIYNLSKDSIQSINVGQKILLNAGYSDNIGSISGGFITKVETDTSKVDVETIITFQDAGSRWLDARLSRTFSGPVTAEYILREALSDIGFSIGTIQLNNNITYQTGKTVRGSAVSVIKQIASETGTPVNISNGRVDLMAEGTGLETGFILNSNTGLIGSPETIDDKDSRSEYKLQMLMNHNIRPRSVFFVESRTFTGFAYVVRGTYNDDFTIEVEIARRL